MGQSSGAGSGRHITGSNRADTLNGGSGGDLIESYGRDDRVEGRGGNDSLFGGRGNDTLLGGDGDDLLIGGEGIDRHDGGRGFDTISFSDPAARHGAVADLSTGRIADDGFGKAETMTGIEGFSGGTLHADRFTGDDGDNYFFLDLKDKGYGLDGDDNFVVNGAAAIDGGAGQDTLAFTLETYVKGNGGTVDLIEADHGITVRLDSGRIVDDGFGNSSAIKGIEIVFGTGFEDSIAGERHANALLGGEGGDTLAGNGGNDTLWGEDGKDLLTGGAGKDWLLGEAGSDTLDGGDGNDSIHGGGGRDLLTGGAGADRFIFEKGDLGETRRDADTITDFSHAQKDRIDLTGIDLGRSRRFEFIGDDAFGGHRGELRFTTSGGDTYVYADYDGDRVADAFIKLDGVHELVAADFII